MPLFLSSLSYFFFSISFLHSFIAFFALSLSLFLFSFSLSLPYFSGASTRVVNFPLKRNPSKSTTNAAIFKENPTKNVFPLIYIRFVVFLLFQYSSPPEPCLCLSVCLSVSLSLMEADQCG